MVNLANLVVSEVSAIAQSDTYTQALLLAANVPENITVPTDQNGKKAGYVVFGAPVASDYFARAFNANEGADRVTNGTFAAYVTNGTFTTDTGWTKGTGWTIGTGVATATGAISTALSQTAAITLIAGYTYTITYTVSRSAGSVTPSIGGVDGVARSSSATFTETIIAGSTQILAFTGAGFTGTLDNISVTAWVLGTGWTTDGTTAIATGAISTALSQTVYWGNPLVAGQPYLVTYTITAAAGSITPSLGATAGTTRTTSATFSEIIIAGSTQALSFGTSGFTGTVDNVTITAAAAVPIDNTSGTVARQNPLGLALSSDASYISVVSAGTPVITASFYQRPL